MIGFLLARIAARTSRILAARRRRRQAVAGQVHRDVVVGVGDERVLDVLGHVDQDRAGPAGARDVERLLDDPGDVPGVLHQVMVLGDRPADLDHRRFLEGVGADDVGGDLAGDRDDRQRVHLGVGQPGDQVQGPGARRRHHDARLAAGAGVALGREDAPLLVAGQDGPDPVAEPRQRLVHRHARPARVGEDDFDAVPYQGLDEHVGPGDRFPAGRGLAFVDGGHGNPLSGRNRSCRSVPDPKGSKKREVPTILRIRPAAGQPATPGTRGDAGGVDLLVNNAGLGDYAEFPDQDPAKVSQIIEVNLMSLLD